MEPNRIREVREGKGLSIATMAKLAGMPYQTAQKAEVGYCTPKPKTVARLAAVLGVKPEDLLVPASAKEASHA